jgi:hypothetical protein
MPKVTGAPAIGAPAASVTLADKATGSPYSALVAPRLVMTAAGGPQHLLSPTVQVSVLVDPLSLTVESHCEETRYSSVAENRRTCESWPANVAWPYFSMSAIGRSKTTQLLV